MRIWLSLLIGLSIASPSLPALAADANPSFQCSNEDCRRDFDNFAVAMGTLIGAGLAMYLPQHVLKTDKEGYIPECLSRVQFGRSLSGHNFAEFQTEFISRTIPLLGATAGVSLHTFGNRAEDLLLFRFVPVIGAFHSDRHQLIAGAGAILIREPSGDNSAVGPIGRLAFYARIKGYTFAALTAEAGGAGGLPHLEVEPSIRFNRMDEWNWSVSYRFVKGYEPKREDHLALLGFAF